MSWLRCAQLAPVALVALVASCAGGPSFEWAANMAVYRGDPTTWSEGEAIPSAVLSFEEDCIVARVTTRTGTLDEFTVAWPEAVRWDDRSKRVEYEGSFYRDGDVISLGMNYSGVPRWHQPPDEACPPVGVLTDIAHLGQ